MSTTFARTAYPFNFIAACFLGVTLILGGCKSTPAGVKNPDGSITNADGSVTYPAGTLPPTGAPPAANGATTSPNGAVTYPAGSEPAVQQQAANPPTATPAAPVTRAAAPPPPPPPAPKVVPSGSRVPVTVTQTLSASRNNVGNGFSGVLRAPLVTRDGTTVFARGTRVAGTVVASKGKGRFKGAGDLAIELTSIGGVRVNSNEYEAVNKGRGKRTAGIVGGGTGLGALIGGLAGGGKGALIGGLAGAGAGTAGAAYTGNRDVIIASESAITFRLTAPLSVR